MTNLLARLGFAEGVRAWVYPQSIGGRFQRLHRVSGWILLAILLGVILANCVQSRWRNDRTQQMRLHIGGLLNDVRGQIVQSGDTPTPEQLRYALSHMWDVWVWAQHNQDKEFIQSFSLIVLRLIFEHLIDLKKCLDSLPQ